MTPEKIKENLNKYKWERWLERPFGAFIISVFTQDSDLRNVGINVEMLGFVFQKGYWYSSQEVFGKFGEDLRKWMAKNHKTMFDISDSCEKFHKESKKKIIKMVKSGVVDKNTMKELQKIFRKNTNYIWVAHGLEEMYMVDLRREIPKYWKGDLNLFIGDISFPKKKNAHTIFEDKLRAGESLEKLAKDFGWMRARDGFEDPFSVQELKEIKEKLMGEKKKPVKKVKVPKAIEKLVDQVQELVYYRTYRTDVFYELLFLARPILKKYGEGLGVEFKDMKHCRIDDLIAGKVKKYPYPVTVAQYKTYFAFYNYNVVPEEKINSKEIKGSIAYKGKAQGIAKIVTVVADLPKVKDGDVLVTHMTIPSFLIAMKKAIAFVTDEGGITCHAAIVAREMKKPCIIGTKNATKILKDGDMVEVDADNGIVKIIK
ncbi:MAG: PEP-utilizing enzyme [Candidatus Staskawiczbacteria bacterium]|jgi:phosphoenolpyruvate synthase/pyruvate phosphate dikinase